MRVLAVVSIVFSIACNLAWAERAGRVDTGRDPTLRCGGRPISDETCKTKRERAISRGCVTREEYDLLAKYNLCPTCDWEQHGLAAYDGFCPSGCFARGTRVLVREIAGGATKWERIEVIAAHFHAYEVWALSADSTLSHPVLWSYPIRMAVTGPETEPMVSIKTQNAILNVTSRHGVLTNAGKMVAAEDLVVGDALLGHDGSRTSILHIERTPSQDDVFNLLLDVDSPISHTIIAEGFLTGDQYWQGELEPLLGTVLVNP